MLAGEVANGAAEVLKVERAARGSRMYWGSAAAQAFETTLAQHPAPEFSCDVGANRRVAVPRGGGIFVRDGGASIIRDIMPLVFAPVLESPSFIVAPGLPHRFESSPFLHQAD